MEQEDWSNMVNEQSFNTIIPVVQGGKKRQLRVGLYTLRSSSGLVAQVTNYGAKLVSLIVPNNQGVKADVVLGFNTLDEWRTKETYFNAVIGRVANRIKDGKFTLDGKEYQLPVNNGTNSLHGGVSGFNEKVWEVVGQTAYSVTLHYRAMDGEEGYPGNMDVTVTYAVTRDNALRITYEATTDAPTLCGFTNHAYFNLAGEGSGRVDDHVLQVLADEYTPFDDTACPTGEVLPVAGTPMDFREPVRVGDRIGDPFFAPGRGIDNNFVTRPATEEERAQNKKDPALRKVAVVSADGRTMEVHTTAPALQVYTGNYVEQNIGKSGKLYDVQHAICLEAQNCPDAINHAEFPSPILRPGQLYRQVTEYKFV